MIAKNFDCFSAKNKRTKTTHDQIEDSLDNNIEINNSRGATFTNVPSDLNRRQSELYSSYASYANVPGSIMNNSYTPHSHQGQQSAYVTNYQTCHKCKSMIIYNTGQFYQCTLCTRLCCFTRYTANSTPNSCHFQCEYCSLESALRVTRCI